MKAGSMTDIGKNREMNEDFLFVSESHVGNLQNLFLVADGMGGHKAGEYASRRSVEVIIEEILKTPEQQPVVLLRKAISKANKVLLEASDSDSEKQGMGTTVVAVTVAENRAYIANVGDSRLYVLNEQIRQVTQDHSLVAEMVKKGELAKSEAKEHPDKNIITRAVGVAPEVEIDFFELELHKGDRILLCSDGLTNMVSDREIHEIVNDSKSLQDAVERLVDAANEHGGRDNITVIVIEPFGGEVKAC